MERITERDYLNALEVIKKYKEQIVNEVEDAVATYDKNMPIAHFPVDEGEKELLYGLVKSITKQLLRHPKHYRFTLPENHNNQYQIKVSDLENINQHGLKRCVCYGKYKNRFPLLKRICNESNIKFID